MELAQLAYEHSEIGLKDILQCITDCSDLTKKEIFDVLQPPRLRKVSYINRIDDILDCITELALQGYNEYEVAVYMRKKNPKLNDKSPLKAIKHGMMIEDVLQVIKDED